MLPTFRKGACRCAATIRSTTRCSVTSRRKRACRADHPLRPIRRMTDAALARLSPRFDRLYATTGRPSIPPEKLLRALLLQVPLHHPQRAAADRAAAIQPAVSLVCRAEHRRPDLGCDDVHEESRSPARRATSPMRSSPEVLGGDRAEGLLVGRAFHRRRHAAGGVGEPEEFPPAGRRPPTPPDDPKNPTVNFRGQPRRNDTHQSTTDPDARLYKKAVGPRSQARLSRRTC